MEHVSGLVIGYFTVSVCECFFHKNILHATPQFRKLCKMSGTVGAQFLAAWQSHHIAHHHLTYRTSHFVQFDCEQEHKALQNRFVSRSQDHIANSDFGNRIGGTRELLWYMGPTLPIFGFICFLGGAWFTVMAMIPLLVWPLLAEFVHPYLHMTHIEASQKASLPTRLFMRTRYYRLLRRHHWLHHKHGNCNFNLLLGGDLILGTHRRLTPKDLAELNDQERIANDK